MRVALFLSLTAMWLAASALNAAWAQRDPFDPLVRPESQPAAGEASGETAPAEPAVPAEPPTVPDLPRTGVDAGSYLLAAAILVAVGGAFMRLDRWITAPV
jgi:LPXTG-motif cell wall-anchored protein